LDERISLEAENVILFKRAGLWQARMKTGKRSYLWRSLKTPFLYEAKPQALSLYHELRYKLSHGLAITSKTLNMVIDEYVAYRTADNLSTKKSGDRGTSSNMLRQIKRVSIFWRQYAGTRKVEEVTDTVLRGYVEWRKNYYKGMQTLPKNARINPTDKTLQWEMMLGKMLIRYAHERGYRGEIALPSYSFTPKIKRARPAFTNEEYDKLSLYITNWCEEPTNANWRYARLLLRDYVAVLAASGMRTGEANNLTVRDVERFTDSQGRENVRLHVRGKTGSRVVIPKVEAAACISRWMETRNQAEASEYLFCMRDGGRIITLLDQFDKVLQRAGLRTGADGANYTLYSLRHYYAVSAINAGLDVYTIARNMGTSVQMIESYYGRSATSEQRAELLGGQTR